MFAVGTKIFLLTSSLHGKMGPRTGSVGYFVRSHESKASQTSEYYMLNADAFFVRYGFEQKKRCEHRNFTAVVPNFKDLETIHQIKSRILSVIKEDKNAKRVKAVAVPADIGSPSCILTDNNEFKAWFSAVMSSKSVMSFAVELNEPLNRSLLSGIVHPINIDILYHSAFSRARRNMHLEEMLNNSHYKETFVAAFKKMWSIYLNKSFRNSLHQAVQASMQPDIVNLAVAHLFTPYFDIFLEAAKTNAKPPRVKLMEDLLKFKIGVGFLRPIVRSNHRLG